MTQSKGLSAISYLSYFFAPFIVPIIIFFITQEDFVKRHSKRAIFSHLIPIVSGIIFAIFFFVSAFSWDTNTGENIYIGDIFTSSLFIVFVIFLIVTFIIAIWNLVQAIKVLR